MNLRQGKVSFQSNDRSDVFLVLEVWENGVEASDEMRIGISDPQFESNHGWVNGKVPQMNPVDVSGDTTVIHAWFTAETLEQQFYLTVYVECEMAEELEEVVLELSEEEEQKLVEQEDGIVNEREENKIQSLKKQSHSRTHESSESEDHFY